jgi:hypothetical protein
MFEVIIIIFLIKVIIIDDALHQLNQLFSWKLLNFIGKSTKGLT